MANNKGYTDIYRKTLETEYPIPWEKIFDYSTKNMDNETQEMLSNEYDPNGKSPHEPGAKLDAGKPAVYRGLFDYFPLACCAVAEVSTFGARKYAWKGWESVPDGFARYSDALGRHLLAESSEGCVDSTTGLKHAAQVAWNAMARLELLLREENGTK